LIDPLIVTIRDAYLNEVEAASADFMVSSTPAGGEDADVNPATAMSAANGQASTQLTLGSVPGAYAVEASGLKPDSSPLANSPIVFTANAVAPGRLVIDTGNNQSGEVTQLLSSPLKVQLLSNDVPPIAIPNEDITFAIQSGYPVGTIDPVLGSGTDTHIVTTDASGYAQTTLTLGDKTGTYTVTASRLGLSVDFTATATPAPSYKVELTGPSSDVRAGVISEAFIIEVKDEYDNLSPIANYITFGLSSTASGTVNFYSDSAGNNELVPAEITVNSPDSSVNFYYKNTSIDQDVDITAARIDGDALTDDSSSVQIDMLPGDLSYFVVGGSGLPMVAGSENRPITITAHDTEHNVKTDYTGDRNLVFYGAFPSPAPSNESPRCSDKNGTDVTFGTSTTLDFGAGVANSTLKLYNVEQTNVRAEEVGVTDSSSYTLDIQVQHNTPDHLKFAADLASPQEAGEHFAFPALEVKDIYDNVCDAQYGATGYNDTKDVIWTLSGESNGPLSGIDTYDANTVTFADGTSTTLLGVFLYRAQTTTITASIDDLPGIDVSSNAIIVEPKPLSQFVFSQQPGTVGPNITTQPFNPQPWVAIGDPYGNPCSGEADTQITLRPSLTQGFYTAVADGRGLNGILNKTTTDGEAQFTGVSYNYPEIIYLEASESVHGFAPTYSFAINVTTADESDMVAGSLVVSGAEVSSLATVDGGGADVFDFKITDGGIDSFGTAIKQIVIDSE